MNNSIFFKRSVALILLATLGGFTGSCKKEASEEEKKEPKPGSEVMVSQNAITPEEFPDNLNIDGFHFPEDSLKIYQWLADQDTIQINKHAWGIWAGLTEKSNQVYKGDTLLVYETWLGVKELADMSANSDKEGGCTKTKTERAHLSIPKQFIHAQVFAKQKAVIDTTFNVFESVSYNPAAACFATSNLIFNQSVLDSYNKTDGIGKIPDFPANSITTKPVYYAGKPDDNGLIRVPVWPGMPSKPQVFGYDDWHTYVYVDINNSQPERTLVPVVGENPSGEQITNASCNVSDFINFKLDSAAAAYLNEHQDKGNDNFKAGDLVFLVAMHVGTKEISNWTWQTYFWSYDPQNPFFPSSKFQADLRPGIITGAAANYSVSSCYAMVWPNQPISGGTDKNATPIVSFNPYLEGSFGPNVFSVKNNFRKDFQYGIQTNCMTCHALATAKGNVGYATDQYIDMKDMSLFKNQVQLDFAWSIQGNINTNK
ncbi:hypothetical protein NHF50_11465 [Flavobacterium sp. NRK F10]|nr:MULTISPECIES: hypothetical protein [Flavobacterium]MCO6175661.1 hypothetical protein [Flavobacterium sp. NRK F10]